MTSPFISSNIPASPAYAVYISPLIHYSEVCAQYIDFLDRVQMQTQKLLYSSVVDFNVKVKVSSILLKHAHVV
jgi:hypothetical protein